MVRAETREADPEPVREPRRLRNDSGLTLAAPARCTGCSESSWERCLNGRTLPRNRPWPLSRERSASPRSRR
ncbi:helix-turn-helix domain-containing protein [Streptomyces sp. CNQ085]|uniref:helix-turn-helix domain-containing protein n=1 Tax=Streptomyces sp. CNQ085 TaxID=2886944 RepID=UPI001F50C832|nr:helix-turn-helix domain-containing protein [Streptomyces sp. CNQ085]MCI0384271.1 helix-turn-helix domain-containing protein [Streptomyces sp. CNQ085]